MIRWREVPSYDLYIFFKIGKVLVLFLKRMEAMVYIQNHLELLYKQTILYRMLLID